MKNRGLIIVGTSEFSEYVYRTIIKEKAAHVVAFALDKEYMSSDTFNELPIVCIDDLNNVFDMCSMEVLLTTGYKKMNEGRRELYLKFNELGYNIASFISSRAIVDSEEIGEGCIIMPMAYIPPFTKLGICNVINVYSILGHTSYIGNFNWFSGNVTMGGNVSVGDNCFIGMNSLLKNGIHIASKTLIGAFSYMGDDSNEGLSYMGNPAQNKRGLKSSIVCDFI